MKRFAQNEPNWWADRSPRLVVLPDGQPVAPDFHPPSEHWLRGGGGEKSTPPDYGTIARPDGWTFRLMPMPVSDPKTWALFIQPPFHHPASHIDEYVRERHGFRRDSKDWETAMAALRRAAKKTWSDLPGGTIPSMRKMVMDDSERRGEALSPSDLRRELRLIYGLSRFPFPPGVDIPAGAKHRFSAKQRRDFHKRQWEQGQIGLHLPESFPSP